jgi:hypothetical protein
MMSSLYFLPRRVIRTCHCAVEELSADQLVVIIIAAPVAISV